MSVFCLFVKIIRNQWTHLHDSRANPVSTCDYYLWNVFIAAIARLAREVLYMGMYVLAHEI